RPLRGDLRQPAAGDVELQPGHIDALALEPLSFEWGVCLAAHLGAARGAQVEGPNVDGGVVDRCVLLEDAKRQALVADHDFGGDDLTLQPGSRLGAGGVGSHPAGGEQATERQSRQRAPHAAARRRSTHMDGRWISAMVGNDSGPRQTLCSSSSPPESRTWRQKRSPSTYWRIFIS